MVLVTAMVLCARSQDSLLLPSVRRMHIVFGIGVFKGGKPRLNTLETTELRRRFLISSRTCGRETRYAFCRVLIIGFKLASYLIR